MKHTKRLAILLATLSIFSVALQAQGLRSALSSENYLYRHQVNPAYGNQKNYISVPVVSNMGISAFSNTSLDKFIFENENGKETTFFDQSIDRTSFLNGLEDHSKLGFNLDMTLFSAGFHMGKGYGTLELNLRTNFHLGIPRDLFAFMKDGAQHDNTSYNISNSEVGARSYAEIALGYSRPINDNLRVGGKVKLLGGIAYAKANIETLKAQYGNSHAGMDDIINGNVGVWDIKLDGYMEAAAGGEFEKDREGYMAGYDASAKFNGFGLALDLGAVYDMKDLVPGLTVSAAITDWGFINWLDVAKATAYDRSFYFNGFQNITPENAGKLKDQWDEIQSDLEDLYKFIPSQGTYTKKESLAATATVGVEYRLPIYDKLAFGLLYSQRFSDYFGYTEGRATVSYAPCRLIDFAVSGSASDYGTTLGAFLNLHLLGLNIFAGSDCLYMGGFTDNMIPLDKIGNDFIVGVNVEFGRKEKEKK